MKRGRFLVRLHAGFLGSVVLGAAAAGSEARPPQAVHVGRQTEALVQADWIDRDGQFAAQKAAESLPPDANPQGVTSADDAAAGCDRIEKRRWVYHAASPERDAWRQVDLRKDYTLDRVVIHNRTDVSSVHRTNGIRVLVADEDDCKHFTDFKEVYRHEGEPLVWSNEEKPLVVDLSDKNVVARIVRVNLPGKCLFALDRIEIFPKADPKKNVADGKWIPRDQKSVGPHSYPGRTVESVVASATDGGFSLAHVRHVVDRGHKLIARLRPSADATRLEPLAAELTEVERRLLKLDKAGQAEEDVRRAIYLDARRLVRAVAFCNPLLDFDKLLFIKRNDPSGLYHMVHQYYGFGAVPGGGLFVLSDPFGPNPKLTNLLENSVVEKGRLKGRKLEGGSFLSPELSFDGKTVLFAYTECKGVKPEWSPRACYHVFKVNADGTGLVQLTDGPWNDFDPCLLPNGRVAFISERRGGYLRCGASAPPWASPTYTLFSMESDGSDVVCLSFHETHEWHPSVDNSGMIVYTRWDYVDRGANIAHHVWTCRPDGSDPRSYHGNYPRKYESRPCMEMSIRAIPGSHRYVATAAAHHGHAFGSLVLIDHRIEDDNAESQLERLTPEVPFPEAEGGMPLIRRRMVYGTPWPLSEDDYLCVYDSRAKNHGIYWIDRFGNRELIYRDPSFDCLSPIPVRPRAVPPTIPEATVQSAAAKTAAGGDRPATIAVMNVYDGDFQWPDGTAISALRVIQLLPKATPPVDKPRIGVAGGTNARAVLGTVPVEADGSVFFEAPAGKPIYFQALDARGMAVQSMRSATYVHPGEQLTCQGCHERKHTAPNTPRTVPLALRRGPSKLRPEPDGSNPFSYVRLVQPVLDRNCVGCHREKEALDLSGVVEGKHGWTRSYANLADKYGFYFHASGGSIDAGVHAGSRTVPGAFGARASKLLEYTDPRHHGVKLSQQDLRRLTLWLDCNSDFFGSYEDTQAQARGEVVWPSLE